MIKVNIKLSIDVHHVKSLNQWNFHIRYHSFIFNFHCFYSKNIDYDHCNYVIDFKWKILYLIQVGSHRIRNTNSVYFTWRSLSFQPIYSLFENTVFLLEWIILCGEDFVLVFHHVFDTFIDFWLSNKKSLQEVGLCFLHF